MFCGLVFDWEGLIWVLGVWFDLVDCLILWFDVLLFGFCCSCLSDCVGFYWELLL